MTNHAGSTGVKRRDFLKVLGAGSAAVATVGCSSEKVGNLVPYLVHPDETVAGVSTYYATTCRECAASCGLIAETRDGRVTKLEGNPEHPLNRGALCARSRAGDACVEHCRHSVGRTPARALRLRLLSLLVRPRI